MEQACREQDRVLSLCFLPQLRRSLPELHHKSERAGARSKRTGGAWSSIKRHLYTHCPGLRADLKALRSAREQIPEPNQGKKKKKKISASRKSRDTAEKSPKQCQAGRMIQRGGLYRRSKRKGQARVCEYTQRAFAKAAKEAKINQQEKRTAAA